MLCTDKDWRLHLPCSSELTGKDIDAGCGPFCLWASGGQEPCPQGTALCWVHKLSNSCWLIGEVLLTGMSGTLHTLYTVGGSMSIPVEQGLFRRGSQSAQVQTELRRPCGAAAEGGQEGCEFWVSPGWTWFIVCCQEEDLSAALDSIILSSLPTLATAPYSPLNTCPLGRPAW